jgi:hypothetical protein
VEVRCAKERSTVCGAVEDGEARSGVDCHGQEPEPEGSVCLADRRGKAMKTPTPTIRVTRSTIERIKALLGGGGKADPKLGAPTIERRDG